MPQIDTVYLAGGFATIFRLKRLAISEYCRVSFWVTKVIGNSSLGGCVKYAERQDGDERIGRIKEISSEISLGNSEDFENHIEYMNFKEIKSYAKLTTA